MNVPCPVPRAVAGTLIAVGVLTASTEWAWWAAGPGGWLLALDLTAGVLAWLLSVLVLHRPVAGAVAVTVLAALSPAATTAATFGALQVARRRRFPVAVAVAAAGVLAHAVQGAWRTVGGMSYGWWLVLITISYGALVGWGAWAQAHAALIRSLHERARRAEAEQGRRVAEARMFERRRLAGEMHDVLAHRLSLVATFAGALEYRPDASPDQVTRAAGVVRDGVHQALDELREVILLLRDDDLEGDGTRPQPVLADLPRLVAESQEAGAAVVLHDEVDDPAALPAAAARTAYRVVQEGLTNARKHAGGQPVRVTVRGAPGGTLDIAIDNPLPTGSAGRPRGRAGQADLAADGDPAGPPSPGRHVASDGAGSSAGVGLVGLTERVHLAGGRLDHAGVDGEFRLHASIPWPA